MDELEADYREHITHLTLHVPSLSVANGRALPLWAWREYVAWQGHHIDNNKAITKAGGTHCVGCI